MFSQADTKEILVTAENVNYIVINEKKYRSLVETAYLNSVPEMAKDLLEGINTPIKDCVELDWKNEL